MSELPFDKLLVALRHKKSPRKQLAADTGRVMNEQQTCINEPLNGSDLSSNSDLFKAHCSHMTVM